MLSSRMFDEDPFFASHREHLRQMDDLFRSPFGFGSGGLLGIEGPRQQHNRIQQQQQQQQQLVPTDLFNFGGAFGGMFHNMRRMMDDMHSTFDTAANDPNSQVFTQSSFMSYSNVGGGQPKVFQASSSTKQAPGGIKETQKMVRDSTSGVEKMAVGHHIGERAHVIERQRNRRTGDQEENQQYINLDEEEAPDFNRQWQEQTRQSHGPGRLNYIRRRQDRSNRRHQALPAPGQRSAHKNAGYRDRE